MHEVGFLHETSKQLHTCKSLLTSQSRLARAQRSEQLSPRALGTMPSALVDASTHAVGRALSHCPSSSLLHWELKGSAVVVVSEKRRT